MGIVKKVLSIVIVIVVFSAIYGGINLLMTSSVDMRQTRIYIYQYINEERANRHLPTLANDTKLSSVSGQWSSYLASINNLTHGDFQSRMQGIGYSQYSCGEIIGSYVSGSVNGLPTTNSPSEIAREFVDMWLNSPPHRQIMLSSSSGYMGIGIDRFRSVFYGVVDFRFM